MAIALGAFQASFAQSDVRPYPPSSVSPYGHFPEEAAKPPRDTSPDAADEQVAASRAYEFGDYSTAHSIWLRLAKQGNAKSQASLAYLYREGRGVRRDSKAAAHWYYRAAVQGDPTAQSFLCDMHLRGDGVARDLELALMWCELSIEGGETRGIWYREQALNQMTTQQRDSAWALVVKWRQVHGRDAQIESAGE